MSPLVEKYSNKGGKKISGDIAALPHGAAFTLIKHAAFGLGL